MKPYVLNTEKRNSIIIKEIGKSKKKHRKRREQKYLLRLENKKARKQLKQELYEANRQNII